MFIIFEKQSEINIETKIRIERTLKFPNTPMVEWQVAALPSWMQVVAQSPLPCKHGSKSLSFLQKHVAQSPIFLQTLS